MINHKYPPNLFQQHLKPRDLEKGRNTQDFSETAGRPDWRLISGNQKCHHDPPLGVGASRGHVIN